MRAAGLPQAAGLLLTDAASERTAGVLVKDPVRARSLRGDVGTPNSPSQPTPLQLRKPLNYGPSSQSLPSPDPAQTCRSCIINETASFLGHPKALGRERYTPKPHPLTNEEILCGKGGAMARLGTPQCWLFRGLELLPPQQLGKSRSLGQRPGGREGR